jgi:hypothetical protein
MCRVCKSPPEVRASIDAQLRAKPKPVAMKIIAAASGISRAEIGRHSLRCIPKVTVKAHGAKMYSGGPIALQYEDGRNIHMFSETPMTDEEFQKCVWVVRIRHEQRNEAAAPKIGQPSLPSDYLSRDEAATVKAKMQTDNRPATDEAAETNDDNIINRTPAPEVIAASNSFVMLRKPEVVQKLDNSPAPEKPLTKKQGMRYKWLHGGRMSLYDD